MDRNSTVGKFPVVEIFGPTLQGEGSQAGVKTHFVRFGYCDSRCRWCDSDHAVLPQLVKKNARWLTSKEIVQHTTLQGVARWVTLSGGNPAIHKLQEVVSGFQDAGYLVHVETQATVAAAWLANCDHVTLSPKPPSSGEVFDEGAFRLVKRVVDRPVTTKVVVFDETDYRWARDVIRPLTRGRLYLSVGTDRPTDEDEQASWNSVMQRYRWLADRVNNDPAMGDVAVLPQLHVLLWGHKLGV